MNVTSMSLDALAVVTGSGGISATVPTGGHTFPVTMGPKSGGATSASATDSDSEGGGFSRARSDSGTTRLATS